MTVPAAAQNVPTNVLAMTPFGHSKLRGLAFAPAGCSVLDSSATMDCGLAEIYLFMSFPQRRASSAASGRKREPSA
jgi:hypothetical protein